MCDKQIVKEQKITSNIITYFFIFGILGIIIYNILYKIVEKIDSMFIMVIVATLLQGLILYYAWKISIIVTFKKETMYTIFVPYVMSKLMLIMIALYAISALSNFQTVKNEMEEIKNSNLYSNSFYLQYLRESAAENGNVLYFSNLKTKDEIEKECKEMVDKEAGKVYGYLAFLQIGLFAVYFIVLSLQKKNILRYTVDKKFKIIDKEENI